RHVADYCPTIDLTNSPGAVLTATGFQLLTECEDMPIAGGGMGGEVVIIFDGCPEPITAPHAPHVVFDLSDSLNISSTPAARRS
ncbi:wif1, partial [Symbiodinium pilosum]